MQLLAQLRFGPALWREQAEAPGPEHSACPGPTEPKAGAAAPRTSVERNGHDIGKRHLMEAPVCCVPRREFEITSHSVVGDTRAPPRPRGALPVAGMSRLALWTAPSEES